MPHQRLCEGRGHGKLRSQERNGAGGPRGFGGTHRGVKAGVSLFKGFPTAPKSTAESPPVLQLVFPPGKPDFPAPPGPEERVLEEGEGWEQAGICCSPALPRGEAQTRQELLWELPARNPIPEVFLAPGTCLRCSWVSLGWCSVCPHHPRLWLRPSKVPAPLGHQGWRGTTAGCVPLVPTPFSIPEMFLTLDVAGTKGPGCPERALVPSLGVTQS